MLKLYAPFIRYLRECRGKFALAVVFGLIYGLSSGAGIPVIFEKVFRTVFESPEGSYDTRHIVAIALALPAVALLRALAGFFNLYLMISCSMDVVRQLRQAVFDKLQDMSLGFFGKKSSGDLITRIINDSGMVEGTLLEFFSEIIRQPVQLLSAVGVLIYLSLRNEDAFFVLLFLAAIPVCLLPVKMIGKKLKLRGRQVQESSGRMLSFINENFSALQEVRAFGLERMQKKRHEGHMREYIGYYLNMVKYEKMQQPIMELISVVIISVIFVYAFEHQIPFSVFSALGLALYFAFDPLKKILALINRLHKTEGAAVRVREVLDHPIPVTDPAAPAEVSRFSAHVRFEDVSFSYGEEPVLNDVNIDIPPGTFCALVGPSGAGKSTFIKLLLRFYDPCDGSITIDQHDLRELSLNDLRRNLALVPQGTVLFNDTLRENIRLGRPEATDAEVELAAKNAFADQFIREFPEGYDTLAGERGDRLSGGQKQRIALARAFLRDAPILLLDEATSALDSESESYVQRALTELVKGKTVFSIAHRLSTIRHADLILVFEAGRIVDCGTHDSLLGKSDAYSNLVAKQSLI